jgi:hypothetical protein
MDFLLKSTKNDTLDPLSVIIKLFICAYKPIGTKISIGNNKLCIQEPGLFQGTIRKIFGDQKNDINIIYFPIIFACKYYLSCKERRNKFIPLFKNILESFQILKETYQGNEIIYNIDQLKTIISSFLESDSFDPTSLCVSYESAGGKIKQQIYSHINTIWTESRLNIIFGLINEILETVSNEIKIVLINTLNVYMVYIDLLTYNLITNL